MDTKIAKKYKVFPLPVRIIASILIITFFTQDIAWAHPYPLVKQPSQSDKLAPGSIFKKKDAAETAGRIFIEHLIENNPLLESNISLAAIAHILGLADMRAWCAGNNLGVDTICNPNNEISQVMVRLPDERILRYFDPVLAEKGPAGFAVEPGSSEAINSHLSREYLAPDFSQESAFANFYEETARAHSPASWYFYNYQADLVIQAFPKRIIKLGKAYKKKPWEEELRLDLNSENARKIQKAVEVLNALGSGNEDVVSLALRFDEETTVVEVDLPSHFLVYGKTDGKVYYQVAHIGKEGRIIYIPRMFLEDIEDPTYIGTVLHHKQMELEDYTHVLADGGMVTHQTAEEAHKRAMEADPFGVYRKIERRCERMMAVGGMFTTLLAKKQRDLVREYIAEQELELERIGVLLSFRPRAAKESLRFGSITRRNIEGMRAEVIFSKEVSRDYIGKVREILDSIARSVFKLACLYDLEQNDNRNALQHYRLSIEVLKTIMENQDVDVGYLPIQIHVRILFILARHKLLIRLKDEFEKFSRLDIGRSISDSERESMDRFMGDNFYYIKKAVIEILTQHWKKAFASDESALEFIRIAKSIKSIKQREYMPAKENGSQKPGRMHRRDFFGIILAGAGTVLLAGKAQAEERGLNIDVGEKLDDRTGGRYPDITDSAESILRAIAMRLRTRYQDIERKGVSLYLRPDGSLVASVKVRMDALSEGGSREIVFSPTDLKDRKLREARIGQMQDVICGISHTAFENTGLNFITYFLKGFLAFLGVMAAVVTYLTVRARQATALRNKYDREAAKADRDRQVGEAHRAGGRGYDLWQKKGRRGALTLSFKDKIDDKAALMRLDLRIISNFLATIQSGCGFSGSDLIATTRAVRNLSGYGEVPGMPTGVITLLIELVEDLRGSNGTAALVRETLSALTTMAGRESYNALLSIPTIRQILQDMELTSDVDFQPAVKMGRKTAIIVHAIPGAIKPVLHVGINGWKAPPAGLWDSLGAVRNDEGTMDMPFYKTEEEGTYQIDIPVPHTGVDRIDFVVNMGDRYLRDRGKDFFIEVKTGGLSFLWQRHRLDQFFRKFLLPLRVLWAYVSRGAGDRGYGLWKRRARRGVLTFPFGGNSNSKDDITRGQERVRRLIYELENGNIEEKRSAARELGTIGPAAEEAISTTGAISDEDTPSPAEVAQQPPKRDLNPAKRPYDGPSGSARFATGDGNWKSSRGDELGKRPLKQATGNIGFDVTVKPESLFPIREITSSLASANIPVDLKAVAIKTDTRSIQLELLNGKERIAFLELGISDELTLEVIEGRPLPESEILGKLGMSCEIIGRKDSVNYDKKVEIRKYKGLKERVEILDFRLAQPLRGAGIGTAWYRSYVEPYIARSGVSLASISGTCVNDTNDPDTRRFWNKQGFNYKHSIDLNYMYSGDTEINTIYLKDSKDFGVYRSKIYELLEEADLLEAQGKTGEARDKRMLASELMVAEAPEDTAQEPAEDEADAVQAAIDAQRGFAPTAERACPGRGWGRDAVSSSVAAVLAGVKPVAVIPSNVADHLTIALVDRAKRDGLTVREEKLQAYGIQQHYIISHRAEDAQAVIDLYHKRASEAISMRQYDEELGRLLGYPEDAIEDFLHRLYGRDYGASAADALSEDALRDFVVFAKGFTGVEGREMVAMPEAEEGYSKKAVILCTDSILEQGAVADLGDTLRRATALNGGMIVLYGNNAGYAAILERLIKGANDSIEIISMRPSDIVDTYNGAGMDEMKELDGLVRRAKSECARSGKTLVGMIKGLTLDIYRKELEQISREQKITIVSFASDTDLYSSADAFVELFNGWNMRDLVVILRPVRTIDEDLAEMREKYMRMLKELETKA